MHPPDRAELTEMTMSADLVQLDGVKKSYASSRLDRSAAKVIAVDGVSFSLAKGETLALVGESGSGKSTIARLICALERPSAGTIHFSGQDLGAVRGRELRTLRRRFQMVLQNPYTSLNPRMRIGALIAEPLRIHRIDKHRQAIDEHVRTLLASVGLPAEIITRYPSMLSGGQRQRVAIARALAVEPDLLVADEPTSALDVSIQAQVVNLLKELQTKLGLACLFITHDLSLVPTIASRVAVMRNGKLVELGATRDVFTAPQAPYTRQLLNDAAERSLLATSASQP